MWPAEAGQKVSWKQHSQLWAGKGVIVAIQRGQHKAMVKIVSPQTPRDLGDRRKAASYENEAHFYSRLYPTLPEDIFVPKPLLVEYPPLTLGMEDIRATWPRSKGLLGMVEARTALSWLAKFHAHFWNNVPEYMAPQGTYFYLDTRPDELEELRRQKRWARLAAAAPAIDARLKHPRVACTLLHGDFKSANMAFSADGLRCAMYDFQYCGRGAPLKDVVNLLGGDLDAHADASMDELLEHYYASLEQALGQRDHTHGGRVALDREIMNEQFQLCAIDLVRFRIGWCGSVHGAGVDNFLSTTERVLGEIDGGQGASKQDYLDGIDRLFPAIRKLCS
eukprot:jgi/Mesvir1/7821/Mv11762-RA.1